MALIDSINASHDTIACSHHTYLVKIFQLYVADYTGYCLCIVFMGSSTVL